MLVSCPTEFLEDRLGGTDKAIELLAEAGFDFLGVWQDFSFTPPSPTAERWYIGARAKK